MRRARAVRAPDWARLKLCRQRKGEPYAELERRQRIARAEWLDVLAFCYLIKVAKGVTPYARRLRHIGMAYRGFRLVELTPADL